MSKRQRIQIVIDTMQSAANDYGFTGPSERHRALRTLANILQNTMNCNVPDSKTMELIQDVVFDAQQVATDDEQRSLFGPTKIAGDIRTTMNAIQLILNS
ncbi:MAG: hypothetical protein KUG64_10425 [Cycloclasticus sp.]|nr:hypothetical protein [Cycloclasticus sp.]